MNTLWQDLKSIKQRDPAARNALEIIFLYSGFHALVFYRVSHGLYRAHLFFLARLVSQLGRFSTPAPPLARGSLSTTAPAW